MTQTFADPIAQRLYLFHREAFYKIRPILPPPFEATPQGYAERDQAVIESIVQLVPVNAAETELAAMAVAGNQLWMHFMREAVRNQDNAQEHDRLTAQAARSGRDARGYLAALDRAQKTRTKRESSRASAELAEIIEENGRSLMLAALSDPPRGMPPQAELGAGAASASPAPMPAPQDGPLAGTAPASPPATPASASPPEPQTAPAAVVHLAAVPRFVPPARKSNAVRPRDEDEPVPDWAAEAEFYAKVYPDRARLIRRLGRLPINCDFGPPEPKLLRAIITGTTPSLLELDVPDPAAEERLRRYA